MWVSLILFFLYIHKSPSYIEDRRKRTHNITQQRSETEDNAAGSGGIEPPTRQSCTTQWRPHVKKLQRKNPDRRSLRATCALLKGIRRRGVGLGRVSFLTAVWTDQRQRSTAHENMLFFFAGAGYCKFERSTGKGRLRTKTCFFNYFGGVDGVLQI